MSNKRWKNMPQLGLEGVERNASFLDKILNNSAHSSNRAANSSHTGYVSGNPNPILGTDKEKELKVIRETRLMNIDQSVKLLEQTVAAVTNQNEKMQQIQRAPVNIANFEPDIPVNNIQAGVNYDVSNMIQPWKVKQNPGGGNRLSMHQMFLEFQKETMGSQENYSNNQGQPTPQQYAARKKFESVESVISTHNAKKSEALASTSMLQRFDTVGNQHNKNVRSQDENQQQIVDQSSRSPYHENKKSSVPVLINKCSSKHITVGMIQQRQKQYQIETGTVQKSTEKEKSSQKVFSLIGQLTNVEHRVSTNHNSPKDGARMRTRNRNISHQDGRISGVQDNINQDRQDTAEFYGVMSSKDRFPTIKNNAPTYHEKQSSKGGAVRFVEGLQYLSPNNLRTLTVTNFTQLDRFNQLKLLGVETGERKKIQNRPIKTREETSNTIIQNQYPMMAQRIHRTLKTPKNPRVKIRLNRSIEKDENGVSLDHGDQSLLKPIQVRQLHTRDRTPLVIGIPTDFRSRRDTERTQADFDHPISRNQYQVDSSFSGIPMPKRSLKSRKKDNIETVMMDESMSDPSTGNNTFRATNKGQEEFKFAQNLENVTTTKNNEAKEYDLRTVQGVPQGGSNPRKIFVEPSVQFNVRNKTRGNPSYGIKGSKPRWHTPINNFPSSDFNATKMSLKSSYENYMDNFIKNARNSKDNSAQQVEQAKSFHSTIPGNRRKFELKLGFENYDMNKNGGYHTPAYPTQHSKRRTYLDDYQKRLGETETINQFAGKMQESIKQGRGTLPLEKSVQLSARSRSKLIDQIEKFRKESGRFGFTPAEVYKKLSNALPDNKRTSETHGAQSSDRPAQSTERMQEDVSFDKEQSDIRENEQGSTQRKYKSSLGDRAPTVNDYTPQHSVPSNAKKELEIGRRMTAGMTDTSYEPAHDILANPKNIKIDELGVQSVKSREQKLEHVRSADPSNKSNRNSIRNSKSVTIQHQHSKLQKITVRKLFNKFHQKVPDANKRVLEGKRLQTFTHYPNRSVFNRSPGGRSPLRGDSLKEKSLNRTERQQSNSKHQENFFRNIENNPKNPLKKELEMQDEFRALQKKLKMKAEEIKMIKQIKQQQGQVTGLLVDQNQKLKTMFQQIFGINLGQDYLTEVTDLKSVSTEAWRKKAKSNATFGESKFQFSAGMSTENKKDGSQLDKILGGIHDSKQNSQAPSAQDSKDNYTLISNEYSPSIQEAPQKIKTREQYIQEVTEAVHQHNLKLQNVLSGGSSKDIIQNQAINERTNSSAHIHKYGIVTTDKDRIKIIDKGREDYLSKSNLVEHQIFNLYHNTINNTLQREKYQTSEHVNALKTQIRYENDELKFLQQQNIHLRKVVNRYKQYVLNFKTEWRNDYLEEVKKPRKQFDYLGQRDPSPQRISSLIANLESPNTPFPLKPSLKINKKSNIQISPCPVNQHLTQELVISNNVLPVIEKLTGELDLGESNQDELNESPKVETPFHSKTYSPQKQPEQRNKLLEKQTTDEQVQKQASQLQISSFGAQQRSEEYSPTKSPSQQYRQPSLFSVIQSDKSIIHDKIDPEKISNFLSKLKNTCKLDKPFDMVLTLIDNVKQFIGCQKVMIVPIDPYFVQILTSKQLNSKERLSQVHTFEFLDKGSGLNKKLICIAKSEDEKSETLIVDSVTQQTEKELFLDGNKVAILLWHNKQEPAPFMALQFEMGGPENQNEKSQTSVTRKPSQMNNSPNRPNKLTKDKKLNRLEVLLLHLLSQGIQIKLESLLSIQKMRDDRLVLDQSVQMVKKLMKCDTLRGLARQMNDVLKDYLKFETINIMFKDPEKDNLYTITFGDEDEHKQHVQKMLKNCKTDAERQAILDKESIQDFVLKGNSMIIYPLYTGITSLVFYKQKSVVINNFLPSSHFDFVNEIDNPKAIKNIDNMLIGCLKREDGSTNGIVQLFNQSKNISPYDKRRFNALRGFFGGCIEKIEDKTRKLTTVMAAKMNYELSRTYVLQCYDAIAHEGTIQAFAHLKKPFDFMDMEIKRDQEDIYGKDGQPPTPLLEPEK